MVGVCVSDKWAGLQLRKGWKWKKISDLVGSSYFMRARIFNFENWIAYTFDIFFQFENDYLKSTWFGCYRYYSGCRKEFKIRIKLYRRNDLPLICLSDRKIIIQFDNVHNVIAQYDYQTMRNLFPFISDRFKVTTQSTFPRYRVT